MEALAGNLPLEGFSLGVTEWIAVVAALTVAQGQSRAAAAIMTASTSPGLTASEVHRAGEQLLLQSPQ